MRVGVFGGTFDPPHTGHYLAAVDAVERLELDQLLFVPNRIQPLKGDASASPQDRAEMLRLLVQGEARFRVDTLELERAGPSYMVDTLDAVASRPECEELFLIVGEDVLPSFRQWKDVDRVSALAVLAVLTRGGTEQSGNEQGAAPPGSIFLPTRRIDISSSEIRERVSQGRSVAGFVPAEVARFIEAKGLYRQRSQSA